MDTPYGDDEPAPVPRGLSFGVAAAAYAEHRPGYPAIAVDFALEPVTRSVAVRVVDLAAGTGQLTAALLARPGLTVTAVEPDPAMLAELQARSPQVTAVPGTAEHIPMADGSVDAVLVGQAFHWFDPARATSEIARVLRPGGVLAALWNHDDQDVEWVAGYRTAAEHDSSASSIPFAQADAMPTHPSLGAPEWAVFRHQYPRTIDSLIATLGTHSWALISTPEEREAAMRRVRAYLLARPETAHAEFAVPLLTHVARSVRR